MTVAQLKTGVAARYSVPESSVGLLDTFMLPLPSSMTLSSVPDGTFIARIKENPVPHLTGSGRISSWVFQLTK